MLENDGAKSIGLKNYALPTVNLVSSHLIPDSELSPTKLCYEVSPPENLPIESLGLPCEKTVSDAVEIPAVLSWICFGFSFIILGPWQSIPYYVGFKRQQQFVGFLLSVMNQCFSTGAPNIFMIIAARFGQSTLQNYDAILRNSTLGSHTHFM